MLQVLLNGHIALFAVIIFSIVLSLTFHEFGHAAMAKWYGDDTAEQLGRLTLNPIPHIDPIGLLMVIAVGFGYARPVPVNPRNFTRPWAGAMVAAAGPFMNLVLAIISVNLLQLGQSGSIEFLAGQGQLTLLYLMTTINLLLMFFNLLPIGPLDGHYIAAYLLPKNLGFKYEVLNARYGSFLLMGIILLSFLGIPIFSYLQQISARVMPYLIFV